MLDRIMDRSNNLHFNVRFHTRQPVSAHRVGIQCWSKVLHFYYRPQSKGDNALGSVRLSVHLSVLSRLNRMTYDLDYQSKVDVCVSVIRGRIRIIARMRSIGVLIKIRIRKNMLRGSQKKVMQGVEEKN